MSKHGKPSDAVKRYGDLALRIRTRRGMSRADVVKRYYKLELLNHDDVPNEDKLGRLENGQLVKVERQEIEAHCHAMNCTPRERALLLLTADRNVIAVDDDAEPDKVTEMLTYLVDWLYRKAREPLADLVSRYDLQYLDDQELAELTQTALELVLKQRRRT
jgi:hypothetical protein